MIAPTTTVDNGGALYVGVYLSSGSEVISSAGGTTSNVEVQSGGSLSVFSGTLDGVTRVAGGTFQGEATIGNGGELVLGIGTVADGSVDMSGTGDTLEIDGTAMPSITISGFAAGDTIYLAGVSGGGAGSATMRMTRIPLLPFGNPQSAFRN